MNGDGGFAVGIDQNPYLPDGGRTVNAIVSLSFNGTAPEGSGSAVAQVFMIDCSASMGYPGTKLIEAKRATAAAVSALRDGAGFAVVAGSDSARAVYPSDGTMAVASPKTRAEAVAALDTLRPAGGTAISTWLTLARQLFATQDATVKHAIMLTDGRNDRETSAELGQVLDSVAGQFVCHSRGVGRDWEAEHLLVIASALNGTADGLTDPTQLTTQFLEMTEDTMGVTLADVSLRIWTPPSAQVGFLKQVHPSIVDLTGRREEVTARVGDYPIGDWGSGNRDFHLAVDMEPGAVGDELRAARVSLVHQGHVLAEENVLAIWTDDHAQSTRINRAVAHYMGQEDLAVAIHDAMTARDAGDEAAATTAFGRALELARAAGNEPTRDLLMKLVEVDGHDGTIRLRRRVNDVDAQLAMVRSVRTIRTGTRPDGG